MISPTPSAYVAQSFAHTILALSRGADHSSDSLGVLGQGAFDPDAAATQRQRRRTRPPGWRIGCSLIGHSGDVGQAGHVIDDDFEAVVAQPATPVQAFGAAEQ